MGELLYNTLMNTTLTQKTVKGWIINLSTKHRFYHNMLSMWGDTTWRRNLMNNLRNVDAKDIFDFIRMCEQ